MANKKFSDFVLGTTVSDIDFVVGYKGLDNIQIAPAQLDSTYDLSLALVNPGVVEVTLGGVNGPEGGSQSQISLVAGGNIEFSVLGPVLQIDNPVENRIIVTGIWKNLFGGSPGIFGDTLEFTASASPAASNSSVFVIPFDCVLENVTAKWIHNVGVNIQGTDTWTVFLYTLNSPDISTTVQANYSLQAQIGVQLTSADNGTFPLKSWDGSIAFSKGDILNVSGVESGTIQTDDAEMEAYLTFKATY